jgi:hypothetical protein
VRRFWLSRATGPIARAFSAHTVNSTPQRATRRPGKHERTTGVNNVWFASQEHTKRLLSIDVFEAAIGVRFELCGKEAGPRWHEWIQDFVCQNWLAGASDQGPSYEVIVGKARLLCGEKLERQQASLPAR